MKRTILSGFFLGLLALGWVAGPGRGRAAGSEVSGQGKLRFRVVYTSTHLPEEAQKVLKGAHGGFFTDLRPGKGETYFSLKGAGIIQISPDLKKTRMIATHEDMKKTNLHNTTLWYAKDGTPFLTWPGNEANKVFTTALDGKLLHTLGTPKDIDLGLGLANDYFAKGGAFIPTDTAYLDGTLYIATGYSKLDAVLTAKVTATKPFKAEWHDLAFGGKGDGPALFGTGHGITVPPGTNRIDVADRPNSEIKRFTRYGQYMSHLSTPKGSFPCDIYYLGNYAIIGALHGVDRSKGAPIYIYENDQLISTIMPKEELGLENFQHIHNAILREVNGKLYVIAQAWNPGDFAILEHVTD